MRTLTRLVAILQLALIGPAAFFLTAVLVGTGDPPQYDLAHLAHRVTSWYVARSWTLLLLLVLPFAALVTGFAMLGYSWNGDVRFPATARPSLAAIPAPVATLVVAWATLTSAAILAIVVLHMAAN